MASNYWIKFYHSTLDDPKAGKLPDNLWRRFFELCLIAGEEDRAGFLPSIEAIAWRLRMDEETLKAEMGQLSMMGFLELALNEDGKEEWFVSNFAKRQHAMSNSIRAKLWREKHKQTKWALPLYKSLPSTPGIYKINCAATGKGYIGATNNLQNRIKGHLYQIGKDEHSMSEDVHAHGVETLSIIVLESIENESDLVTRESYWIDQFPPDDLYNRAAPIQNGAWPANESFGNRSGSVRQDIDIDIDIDIDKDKDKKTKAATPTPSPKAKNKPKAKSKGLDMLKDRTIPEHINNKAFLSAWCDFEKHRQHLGKPLTELSVTKLLNKMDGFNSDEVVEAINDSIASSWSSIFPKHKKQNGRYQTRQTTPTKHQPTQEIILDENGTW